VFGPPYHGETRIGLNPRMLEWFCRGLPTVRPGTIPGQREVLVGTLHVEECSPDDEDGAGTGAEAVPAAGFIDTRGQPSVGEGVDLRQALRRTQPPKLSTWMCGLGGIEKRVGAPRDAHAVLSGEFVGAVGSRRRRRRRAVRARCTG